MAGTQTTRWGVSLHNYLKTYYAPLLFRPHLFFKGLRLLFGDQVIFAAVPISGNVAASTVRFRLWRRLTCAGS